MSYKAWRGTLILSNSFAQCSLTLTTHTRSHKPTQIQRHNVVRSPTSAIGVALAHATAATTQGKLIIVVSTYIAYYYVSGSVSAPYLDRRLIHGRYTVEYVRYIVSSM